MTQFVVRVTCLDQPGIVAAITSVLHGEGLNVLRLDQFTDPDHLPVTIAPVHGGVGGSFFFRCVVESQEPLTDDDAARLRRDLDARLEGATVELMRHPATLRVAALASKTDHCLEEVLRRAADGEIGATITTVISNHDSHRKLCEFYGVDFRYIPATHLSREDHEAAVREAIGEDVDLIVLARYMRILSEDFLRAAPCPIINIHHSFLPSFIGANPYQRAHDRGVKMIGATGHYVTADLDEGPIIEQDVVRVDHRQDKEELVKAGADVERSVFYRAVKAHCQGRVFLDGDRTVVFD